MIRTLTAYTHEIDDVQDALDEILEQLDLEGNLLQNSVGLVSCYAEFIESGVVEKLCEALPFDVIGTTTLGTATGAEFGELLLGVVVLTSDDVQFSTALSASLTEELAPPLQQAFTAAKAALPGAPVMLFAYAPLIFNVGGDLILDALNTVSGGLPTFGTLACDHTDNYEMSQVFRNGETSKGGAALLLISGNLDPKFYVGTLSEDKKFKHSAVITKSHQNILQTVNNVTVLEYMESIGLAKEGKIDGINSIPFLIDHNDGTLPIVRAIFALTEEGEAVCGGNMPEGATLSIISMEADDVVNTTGETVAKTMGQGAQAMLMFSCIGRNLALGVENQLEMQQVARRVGGAVPYLFSYSGGEICPVRGEDGKWHNRFHNDTFIVCAF